MRKPTARPSKRRLALCTIAVSFFVSACASADPVVSSAPIATADPSPQSRCIPRAALDAYVQQGILRKADVYDALNPAPGSVMFVGSSLMEEGRWSEWLDSTFPNARILNRGIGSETTGDLARRLDTIIEDRPATIVINTGGNDLSRLNREPQQVLKDIDSLLGRISKEGPNSRVVLTALLPREARYADAIAEMNSGLSRLAHDYNFGFVDASARLGDASGVLRPELTNDGIHLNPDGYDIWVSAIRTRLSAP